LGVFYAILLKLNRIENDTIKYADCSGT